MYVIMRNDGAYVNRLGEASSYTRFLEHARKFNTRESAQCECCGNETVVSVYDILERTR